MTVVAHPDAVITPGHPGDLGWIVSPGDSSARALLGAMAGHSVGFRRAMHALYQGAARPYGGDLEALLTLRPDLARFLRRLARLPVATGPAPSAAPDRHRDPERCARLAAALARRDAKVRAWIASAMDLAEAGAWRAAGIGAARIILSPGGTFQFAGGRDEGTPAVIVPCGEAILAYDPRDGAIAGWPERPALIGDDGAVELQAETGAPIGLALDLPGWVRSIGWDKTGAAAPLIDGCPAVLILDWNDWRVARLIRAARGGFVTASDEAAEAAERALKAWRRTAIEPKRDVLVVESA